MTSTVVIYRLGSLGDTIVALPCFHRIMASFPKSDRLVLTNLPVSAKAAPLEAILRPGGFIQGAITYPAGTRDPAEVLKIRRALRAVGSDTLIYLGGGRGRLSVLRDLVLLKACGFRKVIGAPLTRDLEHPRTEADGSEEPETERLARCIASLGPIDLDDRASWDLRLTPEERQTGQNFVAPLGGRPFLAVNTGGKVPNKDWGEENWLELLRQLSEVAKIPLVVLGGADDSPRAQRLLQAWPGPSLDGTGRLSPRESAAVLAHARLFIGHDSGPLHLAAAMSRPCVGLFGDYNRPRRWHPYGRSHIVLHDITGIAHITPASVKAAALDLLSRSPG
jgi:heptosyltransferase-3